jgi:glycosyltransferase involved in cell wall biosynthesis
VNNDANMLITIITSTLNCEDALERTAFSIRNQEYKNIQWIIKDGGSIDNTIGVINKNLDIVSDWFSEPDDGIYDAWNKACELIQGDWVLFFGAGDEFVNTDTLGKCVRKLKMIGQGYNFAFGSIMLFDGNNWIEKSHVGEFKPRWVDLNYTTPCHAATFTRSLLLSNNPFDAKLKVIADKKFMIKYSEGKYYNLEICSTKFDSNGISSNIENTYNIWKEHIQISKAGPKVPFVHKIRAYIVNYRRIMMLKVLGVNLFRKFCR